MKALYGSRPGRRAAPSGARLVLAMTLAVSAAGLQAQDNDDALAHLKAMSDYVSSQENIRLTFDSAIEVITPTLEKIQFTNSGAALLSRPNKLHAQRVGGYADVALYFDGATVSVYGKEINSYAQFPGPESVDLLIEALRAGHGVALPGADLLRSNPYELLSADVLEAKYVGRGVIDGRECEHLAFRNFDTDWQLWIEVGERPVPRKMVITSKTINGAPQYTLQLKQWDTDVKPGADAFAFAPPPGATRLEPDQLIGLDELPEGAPAGGAQ